MSDGGTGYAYSTLGQYGAGNIDLYNRPVLHNDDGSISTVESFSVNIDGIEVLLPSIINGERVSEEEAIKMSKLTKGYAYAYQVLGYILFDAKKAKLDDDIVNEFDTYLREYVYEKIYFDMPDNEKMVVAALASSKEKKVADIINSTNINKEKMSQYRDKLIKKGVIVSTGWGKLDFALPRFNEYVLLQKEFA